jgi:type I restriction enzyme M protein
MGVLVSRAERVLPPADIAVISGAYHAWLGARESPLDGLPPYADVPGLVRSASLAEVRGRDHVLAPGQYVGVPRAAAPGDAESAQDKVERLAQDLLESLDESARLEQAVREQLARLAIPRMPRPSGWPGSRD